MQQQLTHDEVMAKRKKAAYSRKCILILNDIQLPANIASIFRLADGFLVDKIIVQGENEFIASKKFRSIARIHEDNIPYEVLREKECIRRIDEYKKTGYSIIALEYTDKSLPLTTLPTSDIVLIAGSESRGIHELFLSVSDKTVHIPMEGNISSFNVATCLGIALYEIRRANI